MSAEDLDGTVVDGLLVNIRAKASPISKQVIISLSEFHPLFFFGGCVDAGAGVAVRMNGLFASCLLSVTFIKLNK